MKRAGETNDTLTKDLVSNVFLGHGDRRPETGVYRESTRATLAPFRIVPPVGSHDYYVKLLDWTTKREK